MLGISRLWRAVLLQGALLGPTLLGWQEGLPLRGRFSTPACIRTSTWLAACRHCPHCYFRPRPQCGQLGPRLNLCADGRSPHLPPRVPPSRPAQPAATEEEPEATFHGRGQSMFVLSPSRTVVAYKKVDEAEEARLQAQREATAAKAAASAKPSWAASMNGNGNGASGKGRA